MAQGAMELESSLSRAVSGVSPALFRHVVCLTGRSPDAAVAESHAELIAEASGASLTLYHASDIGIAHGARDPMPFGDLRTPAEGFVPGTLGRTAERTGGERTRRQMVVERRSPTAATMAAAVRRLGADIVVMAPHDRGALSRSLGFSLTEATVDRLDGAVPVLCARGDARPYRRILVATDFSAGSRRSFRLTARLAQLFGATVTVLHAVADDGDTDCALASMRRFIPRELAHRGPRLVVEAGEPCSIILSTARTMEADLIVLSTHGRDSLRDAVLGTHAQRIIRRASCPVLVP